MEDGDSFDVLTDNTTMKQVLIKTLLSSLEDVHGVCVLKTCDSETIYKSKKLLQLNVMRYFTPGVTAA